MARPLRRRRARLDAGTYRMAAQRRLRRYRQASMLAVAVTGMLLLLAGDPAGAAAAGSSAPARSATSSEAIGEFARNLRELASGVYGFLPHLLFVVLIAAVAAIVARAARAVIERSLHRWRRVAAVTAVTRLVIFVVAIVTIVSVIAGDVRAVAGSLGLLGLAASWALQTPIESFTGWLLNAFRGYYRVGDRIGVGDVFGDVYRIDVLTTTVWEAGGPGKAVTAAQPTGALITFPNWEILRSNIVNYSRGFPFVWDEISTNVANESDLAYASAVIEAAARRVLGDRMEAAARKYEALLRRQHLKFEVEELPKVYLASADSWTECTVRYLAPVRARRGLASRLLLEISQELAKPEHRGRILPVYPRREIVMHPSWDAPHDAGATSSSRT